MWDKIVHFLTEADKKIDSGLAAYESFCDRGETKFMKKVCKTDKTIDQVLDVALDSTVNLFKTANQKLKEYRSGPPR